MAQNKLKTLYSNLFKKNKLFKKPEKKVFLLGVGSQKSGTTWLHNYLAQRDDTNFGFAKKEYHIFDAVTLKEFKKFKKSQENTLKKFAFDPKKVRKLYRARKLLSFMNDTQKYFDYFSDLLKNNPILLSGDITPSYSGLSEETLHLIKDEFNKRDVDVKVVFIMRDPVMRLQSMIRMWFRQKGVYPTLEQEITEMEKNINTPKEQLRGRYDLTVQRLDNVFADNVFYVFYEELFTENTIQKLCEFLEIPYSPADFSVEKNVSRTSNKLSQESIDYFRQELSNVYDFCAERFGRERVESLWGYK